MGHSESDRVTNGKRKPIVQTQFNKAATSSEPSSGLKQLALIHYKHSLAQNNLHSIGKEKKSSVPAERLTFHPFGTLWYPRK